MNPLERLTALCQQALSNKNLSQDKRYITRLSWELSEIDAQDEVEYFLEIYDKKYRYATNENNLLTEWLLGSVEAIDVDQFPEFIYGELPDIDIDYLPQIKEHIHEWAIRTFGINRVCAIGTYNCFGIKSTLLDMARVHDYDNKEINSITKKIGLKDDDGKTMTWEKALQLFPELKAYCDAKPEVAIATGKLLHRNRGMGSHAGGLIISSVDLNNIVPIVRGKDGRHTSAYPEGLHGTDLSPLGLIKFDVLAIKDLYKTVECCEIIKKRHGLSGIFSTDGQRDWSDTSYLEDPKALALANQGKLFGVFQFDSTGIRELAKEGGVSCFDDIVAYTSLYRPGPMGEKMHKAYVNRKRGKEQYTLHPVLEKILGMTYGVMCYQEQVMKILHVVGGIPLKDCEIVRKAISKKKVEKFMKYKTMFLENGQKVLGWTLEQITELWQQIESFAEYGFNKSHAVAYSYITSRILTLKAHWPIEFYLTTIKNENDTDKVRMYKTDGEKNGIKFHRLDLNKSKENFAIIDDQIYIGFGNVKGIGEEAAARIVANQPYSSFEDFLNKFGTDARIIVPLVALRLFEGDPKVLYEFYEFYKKGNQKRITRAKTNAESRQKVLGEVLEHLNGQCEPTQEAIEKYILTDYATELGKSDEVKELVKKLNKYKRNVESYNEKVAADQPLTLELFEPTGEIDSELATMCEQDVSFAESEHYGFGWQHTLEKCPQFQNKRFSNFDDDDTLVSGPVEVVVVEEPKKVAMKKKENSFYYTVLLEDADWKRNTVTFWSNDYERWKEELVVGNLLRIQVRPPGDYNRYTFFSYPRNMRLPEKNQDPRLIKLDFPESKKSDLIEELRNAG